MVRRRLVFVALLAGICLGSAAVAANEAPLADAGLDQEVTEGATVYLDAGGSIDPDGEIESYRWTLTAPDGTTTAPDCATCARTQFLADRSGTYNATVTVTDDDGASRSDTLEVTVRPSDPPSVDLTGPTSGQVDDNGSYEASVTAGDRSLSTLRWERNGSEVSQQKLDGDSATRNRSVTYTEAGPEILGVVVTDANGQTARQNLTVDVEGEANEAGGGSGGNSYNMPHMDSEIEQKTDGTFRINLIGDDDTASNTIGQEDVDQGAATDRKPDFGSDKSGYGIERSTLSFIAKHTKEIEKLRDTDALTRYKVGGDVAENFEEHSVGSGQYVGTSEKNHIK